jgi:hypothetical protein
LPNQCRKNDEKLNKPKEKGRKKTNKKEGVLTA